MDAKIEGEHALAVTHYEWLTEVIEFCLEKIHFIYENPFLVEKKERAEQQKAKELVSLRLITVCDKCKISS